MDGLCSSIVFCQLDPILDVAFLYRLERKQEISPTRRRQYRSQTERSSNLEGYEAKVHEFGAFEMP